MSTGEQHLDMKYMGGQMLRYDRIKKILSLIRNETEAADF